MLTSNEHNEKRPSLCIVVLNWNKPLDTLECLNSLLPAIQSNHAKLVVCDNNSDDDSLQQFVDWIEQYFDCSAIDKTTDSSGNCEAKVFVDWDIVLLKTADNLGYAAGNNAGIKFALAHGDFSYILLLNNDTVVDKKAVSELLHYAETHPEHGVIGSTLLNYANPYELECAGGCQYKPFTTIIKNKYQFSPSHSIHERREKLEIDYVHGAAALFRREVFDKFGLLDERYFLFYEELDFAQRLKNSQYSLGWCRKSLVYHKGGHTVFNREDAREQSIVYIRNYHENLSTLLYSHKHYRHYYLLPALLRFIGKSAKFIGENKLHYFPALFHAYWNFFFSGRWKKTRKASSHPASAKLISAGWNK